MTQPSGLFPQDLFEEAKALVAALAARGWTLATAESCTGGLISGLMTEVPGSSAVLGYGFVTYANAAKTALIGVSSDILVAQGAVSEPTARAMAEGALRAASAHIAVAVTGIAGPGGGSPEKPVGLVHFACARATGETRHLVRRYGDLGRSQVRLATVRDAVKLLADTMADTVADQDASG